MAATCKASLVPKQWMTEENDSTLKGGIRRNLKTSTNSCADSRGAYSMTAGAVQSTLIQRWQIWLWLKMVAVSVKPVAKKSQPSPKSFLAPQRAMWSARFGVRRAASACSSKNLQLLNSLRKTLDPKKIILPRSVILLMEEILHHLLSLKPYEK